jgi:hypothetical protein
MRNGSLTGGCPCSLRSQFRELLVAWCSNNIECWWHVGRIIVSSEPDRLMRDHGDDFSKCLGPVGQLGHDITTWNDDRNGERFGRFHVNGAF